jgi:hypothetical protein
MSKKQSEALMLRSQRELGVWKAPVALTSREMATKFPISFLTVPTLMRLGISLVIAVLIVIVLTSPSGGQASQSARVETASSWPQQQDGAAASFERCLQNWDAGTHMTKLEWRGACQRLLNERGDYLPNHGQ